MPREEFCYQLSKSMERLTFENGLADIEISVLDDEIFHLHKVKIFIFYNLISLKFLSVSSIGSMQRLIKLS